MSKRPFNKIRRIQKKENTELAQENKEDNNEQFNPTNTEVTKPLIPQLPKKRIQIVNNDANKKEESLEPSIKISLGSKPNLFKGKKEGGKLIINSNRTSANNDPAQESYKQAIQPTPTPMVIKKRGNLDFKRNQRQNIVIQEEESQRFGQQNKEANVQESASFPKKLDLKIKRLNQRREFQQKPEIQQQSFDFSRSRQPAPPQTESNTPAHVQYRQINIQPVATVSQGKVDKQRKRTNQLRNLLNLEIDLYEQTLSIGNVTPYEIYINKIKGGYLKNSQDQAFDQKSTNACQTLSYQYTDFTNQCPQDYKVDVNRIQTLDANHLFDQFILSVAPVIEQLIKPTNSITQPPIFLLAFRPSFKSFLKCPYPVFLYHSEEFTLDLIVIGQKLYITEGEIQSVLMIGKMIIAGLKNGQLIFWNGENSKSSRLYKRIKQFTNTTNFQLPAFCNNNLQKFSPYASQVPIVGLLHDQRSDFYSLDSSGKLVKWTIQQGQKDSQSLKGVSLVDLRTLVQRASLKTYSLKKRGENLYVNSSLGVLYLHNNQIKQKLDNQGIKVIDFQLPKRSPLVFTINENNSLQIYNQTYSQRLFTMDFSTGAEHLTQIIIPELQHQNRQIIILSTFYVTDSAGAVYEIKILQNPCEYSKKLGDEQDSRREKNVIFRGVNRVGESLETLRLMRDLKLKMQIMKMGINTEKSVGNLKSIIEKNRQLMTFLEEQNPVIF